jgi:PAS domain-containing protein
MNILLIGFRYDEIEEIQDHLLAEFPQFKIDFAISIRDSWYRLKISFYDLIILDATSSETDSLVTFREVSIRSEGIPVVLIAPEEEIENISRLNRNRPKFAFAKENCYLEKLISMLKKGEEPTFDVGLHHQLQLQEDRDRIFRYFHTSINMILDSLFIANSRFEIVEANNAFLEEFQVTRKAIVGKSCHQIIHQLTEPCGEKQWTCPLKEVFRLGMPYQSSFNRYNDAEKIIVKAIPIRNELNQLDQVVVTLRKEAVLANAHSQPLFNRSLLELMLSGLSDGLLFCNSENKILLLNQAAESILDIPKAKLIEQSIFNLPLGEGRGWLAEVLNGVNTNMRFNSLAFKARINNHFVQIRFAPIFGQENYYLGGFLYLTEVEEGAAIDRDESQLILNDKIFDILHLTSPQVIAEG